MFQVVAPPGEAVRKELDLQQLRISAMKSRGRFYEVAGREDVFSQLPPGKPVQVASLPPLPLWNNWRMLLLFVGLLLCEWLLRKRLGML